MKLEQQSIGTLCQLLQDGDLTALELCQFYLERIENYDFHGPQLNSVIELNPDVLNLAEILDIERSKKISRGPLHGIPILLKDNIDTGDRMVTSAGSLALEKSYAKRDAFLVQKLRNAGAIFLGKTNLSEWANFRSSESVSGWSSRGGQTRNPFDILRNPSGSSSGSAVAVAAGFCAAAIGTETDGSILSPSSMNGVVGLKPNVGRISRRGLIPISYSQDTPGPITRNVADADLLLKVMSGEDIEDPVTLNSSKMPIKDDYFNKMGHLKDWTIGVVRNLNCSQSKVEILLEDAIQILKDLGAIVKDPIYPKNIINLKKPEFEVLLHEFKHGINHYLSELEGNSEWHPPDSLENLITFNETHKHKMMPYFGQDLFESALKRRNLNSKLYQESLLECSRLSRLQGIDALLKEHELDVFISLTTGPAWLTDYILGDPISLTPSFKPSAVAGYPGISVPLGLLSGLPIGISFFGGAWSENKLIRCAIEFENSIIPQKPPTLK
jgi:amidase